MPPSQVALSDPGTTLHQNISIYEILGAPEFRLVDGGGLVTTRPTREDVAYMLRSWLGDADMLSPSIARSHYLLTVQFEELHGPNVVPFTDKHASATVNYVLTERASGRIVFNQTYSAQMQARMPGVTPEMVRAALGGAVYGAVLGPEIADSVDRDERIANAGLAGAFAGLASAGFAADHDTLLWDWPVAVAEALPRLGRGAGGGLIIGALAADAEDGVSDARASRIGAWAGGTIGFFAAAPTGRGPENMHSIETRGSFWGTERSEQAVNGMMRQHFNQFLVGLDSMGMLNIRSAVACEELNPGGVGMAYISTTADSVGYDCPRSARSRRTRERLP
jgi:hypothetical protein